MDDTDDQGAGCGDEDAVSAGFVINDFVKALENRRSELTHWTKTEDNSLEPVPTFRRGVSDAASIAPDAVSKILTVRHLH